MNWFYATKDKTQAGPVDEATLASLLQAGTITADTLIWKEGMANWAPYSSVLSVPAPTFAVGTPTAGTTRCSECGQPFPPDQLISLAGRSVCASCKPLAVQKFQEGVVSFGRPQDAEEIWARIQQRGYDFTIGSVISRSWELVKANFWPSLGVTLLCYLIMMASGQIPFLGIIAVFLVQPQTMAGLNWYFVKQFRGEPATLNDAFEGFRRGFGQQAVYMLIVCAIVFGVVIAVAIPMAIIIPLISKASGNSDTASAITAIVIGIVAIPFVLALWYLIICWIFTPLLILDKGLKATAAMKLSRRAVQLRFWKILGLFFVMMLLSLLGVAALCVGLLVVLPLFFATISRLYEDIFSEEGPAAIA